MNELQLNTQPETTDTVADLLARPFEERKEVIEAMDLFERECWSQTRIKRERSRLKRLGVKSGVDGQLWYRLLAANALIRSAEIHDHEQREARRKKKVHKRH